MKQMKTGKAVFGALLFSLVIGTAFYVAHIRAYQNASIEIFTQESAKEINFQASDKGQAGQISPLDFTCTKELEKSFDCYATYYKNIVKNFDIKTAFLDLRKRYDESQYVKENCHAFAHIIGNKAVDHYPTVSEAYQQGDAFCWSGYYHGVLEGVIKKLNISDLRPYLNDFCKDIPGKNSYSFDYFNCVHGIGHGIMAFTNDEVPESLQWCDSLKGNWEKQSCYGGVFMENVMVDNRNHFTKYLKSSDLLYPCNAVKEKYRGICYLMQTSYMFKASNYDFQKVFELCSSIESQYQNTCYQSLGRDASTYARENSKDTLLSIAKTKTFCDLGKDDRQKSNCIIGAVKDFISFYHSREEADQLCYYVQQEIQTICLKTSRQYYKAF